MVMLGLVKAGQALFRLGNIRTVILEIFAGGYLFAYLQGILHSSAAGDRELPDLPGISNFLEDVTGSEEKAVDQSIRARRKARLFTRFYFAHGRGSPNIIAARAEALQHLVCDFFCPVFALLFFADVSAGGLGARVQAAVRAV